MARLARRLIFGHLEGPYNQLESSANVESPGLPAQFFIGGVDKAGDRRPWQLDEGVLDRMGGAEQHDRWTDRATT